MQERIRLITVSIVTIEMPNDPRLINALSIQTPGSPFRTEYFGGWLRPKYTFYSFICAFAFLPKHRTFEEIHVYHLIARARLLARARHARSRPAWITSSHLTYFDYYSHFRSKMKSATNPKYPEHRLIHSRLQFGPRKKVEGIGKRS